MTAERTQAQSSVHLSGTRLEVCGVVFKRTHFVRLFHVMGFSLNSPSNGEELGLLPDNFSSRLPRSPVWFDARVLGMTLRASGRALPRGGTPKTVSIAQERILGAAEVLFAQLVVAAGRRSDSRSRCSE